MPEIAKRNTLPEKQRNNWTRAKKKWSVSANNLERLFGLPIRCYVIISIVFWSWRHTNTEWSTSAAAAALCRQKLASAGMASAAVCGYALPCTLKMKHCASNTSVNKTLARIVGIITFMLFVFGIFCSFSSTLIIARCVFFFSYSTINVRTYAHSLCHRLFPFVFIFVITFFSLILFSSSLTLALTFFRKNLFSASCFYSFHFSLIR